MRAITGSLAFLSLLLAAIAAHGATVVVPPGPGTPVQDAIDAASPGDTIRLMVGTYPEHLFINKSIRLRGVRGTSVDPNGTTKVGGGCGGLNATIRIIAQDVQLQGLQVLGDTPGGVDLLGNRIKLTDIFVSSECPGVTVALFNIEQGWHVKLSRLWAVGSPFFDQNIPAGIRIADIVPNGYVRLSKSASAHNEIGVLLDNVGSGAVRLTRSAVNFNDRGIVLQNADGAIVNGNELVDDTTSGIEIDAASSGNVILGNRISGSVTDVADAGSGNCWRRNSFTTGTVAPCP